MKTMQIELSDKLAEGLQTIVRSGWFQNEEEAVRYALMEMISNRKLNLNEKFMLDDIEWALKEKNKKTVNTVI